MDATSSNGKELENYDIAQAVRASQDQAKMLRMALERIIQLYTDHAHFVYELLQNAEDAGAHNIKFAQYSDHLEVLHDGKPFTLSNLKGLCGVGQSDKIEDLNQIGQFGVGFKSVYGICNTVDLYSSPDNYKGKEHVDARPFAVRINDFTQPKKIPQEPLKEEFTTRFVFPYSFGKTYSGYQSKSKLNQALSNRLQNLGSTTLLFMRNLESIEYKIQTDEIHTEGLYLFSKERLSEQCTFVSTIGSSAKGKQNREEEISYLKFSRRIDSVSNRTVDIAIPVSKSLTGDYQYLPPPTPYTFVYFPTTTESKLHFIVQGPYRTTPNRANIPADNEDNIRFAKETAILLRDAILELRDSGKLNLTFIKALPIFEEDFKFYGLFKPLHDVVIKLFKNDKILPCLYGGYTSPSIAKIARREELTTLFPDPELSALIYDGIQYHWLPTSITETNAEYKQIYSFLTTGLGIPALRSEDLKPYFATNPSFLRSKDDFWLTKFYEVLSYRQQAFSKAKNSKNLLTAEIIKTDTGDFVAPFREIENGEYISNVFLPSDKKQNYKTIHFVDPGIYKKCRHFFDDILHLEKPNEYELFLQDIRHRYSMDSHEEDERKHIEDVRQLYEFLQYKQYETEIRNFIETDFALKCEGGRMENPYNSTIYLQETADGIKLKGYLSNLLARFSFINQGFYKKHGIPSSMLEALGVRGSILSGETQVEGQYDNGHPGRQPHWNTEGEFRWKLSIDRLREVLLYIAKHPNEKDAWIKSKTILDLLFLNERKLQGTVHISGNNPDLENESCDLIKSLKKELRSFRDWNGKLLYNQSMELVSHTEISKYDLNSSIYGPVHQGSSVYALLGFKKTEDDEVEELKEIATQAQLDAYFESEFRNRFKISTKEFMMRHENEVPQEETASFGIDPVYDFPTAPVRHPEALERHAAEIYCFANPVQYQSISRRIRVSSQQDQAQSYLKAMYQYDGCKEYACQMCHKNHLHIEAIQLFNSANLELAPMHVCLCPNCAAKYHGFRHDKTLMAVLKDDILRLQDFSVTGTNHVSIPISDKELWFTETHIAEIQALLKIDAKKA